MAAKGGSIVSFYCKGAYGPFGYQIVYGIAAIIHIGVSCCWHQGGEAEGDENSLLLSSRSIFLYFPSSPKEVPCSEWYIPYHFMRIAHKEFPITFHGFPYVM